MPVLARALRGSLLLPLLTLACASAPPLRVPAVRPAEVDLHGAQRIAVGELTLTPGRSLAVPLEAALAGTQKFTLVERSRAEQAFRALGISTSERPDPAKLARLAALLPEGGAFIYGDLAEDYREMPSDRQIPNDPSKGGGGRLRMVNAELQERGTFYVVDILTGKLLGTRSFLERRSDYSEAMDIRPPAIDRHVMERSARAAIIDHFVNVLTPSADYVQSRFDRSGPGADKAIPLAEQGEWAKAQAAFEAAAAEAEKTGAGAAKVGKACWNVALAYEYGGEPAKAIPWLEKAISVAGQAEYRDELQQLRPAGPAGGPR